MTSGLTAVADALDGARRVAVYCHIRPDADTIGSGLALARVLRTRGAEVSISHPGPALPSGIGRLADAAAFREPIDVADVAVAVDCASSERLGSLEESFLSSPVRVVIDHHATNTGFGTVNLIDPAANSTTELVLAVADALQVPLDAETADCLYAGLVTDTGSFRWTSPTGHIMAARLLGAGAQGRELAQDLLDTHPRGWFTMAAGVLGSARAALDAFGGLGVVYAVCSAADRGTLGWDAAESLIDLLRTADDCEVAALFKEGEPGTWSASLRARSAVDVAAFAREVGGGGHRLAAGYTTRGTADEVVQAFLERV
ncbi:Phosphoesterase RecJ domain protein OS=Tsukamurella paurometabola (strain ATCC 8368 / DSM /CCUG 35730 / CIP 100753 / JCM 10117 / KCTC 9821 / NBRC 16120/ NCIMB 702349 / NCTC 13040) OX=521096 GN=Tpau_1718 PE=4 SV=1 [Tsukamurella paurometabola]|uniref:Phosphoesterase RecJ domain protein n=1 Tax=Tsukamurella paurometabola (strain ATCC 8368 / DSM 20162 / CCUG 35730 / CIP 100753 / JCM 10117 / KCTC 9821 / NBRC 16120 / NCIMB 702349 / NCTC 13040) TaxID=521096 RepID=D5UM56_TSUPD|nr:bifunctional oligoribonuclease/PAP phosphatase NrnA [Tsukamurella paurometabola]ADG78336.1 phosphoesterase RecJ domain protein [Tsukamurella paurometabola DSM 20162]SUP31258.1 Bifunctional oligoribonuclease and PAP phosphatase nrnA [Tsukamurella paurometabola]